MTWVKGKQIDGKTYVEFDHVKSLMKSKDEEIERLREALRPFADRAAAYDPPENDDAESDWWNVNRPTIGDLRKARAALG